MYEGQEYVYRRSPKANYFVYDITTKKVTQLSDKGKQFFPNFSPDGKKIAYVRENNLFIKEESIAPIVPGQTPLKIL